MYINVHTHKLAQTEDTKEILVLDPRDIPKEFISDQQYCLGVHPWFISESNIDQVKNVCLELNRKNQLFAFGEIGLDKMKGPELEEQITIFRSQINFCQENDINKIVIHSVKAYSEIFQILKDEKYNGKIILHDFNSTIEMAKQWESAFDVYFSLGSKILNPKTKAAKALLKINPKRLFLETDDNSPEILLDLYQEISKTLKLSLSDLQKLIHNNYKSFIEN